MIMSVMFCYDIETLDLESTAVILSAAITCFELNDANLYSSSTELFNELLKRGHLIKFDAKDQVSLGRTVGKSTLDWWATQDKEVRKYSLTPTPNDVSAKEGIERIINYVKFWGGQKDGLFWIRGGLDQLCTESLCKKVGYANGVGDILHYNRWCDVRTFLRLMKDTTDRQGYCTVPDFDKNLVAKHNPLHDVCYDALMMLRGE
jgi:hypothetical protein